MLPASSFAARPTSRRKTAIARSAPTLPPITRGRRCCVEARPTRGPPCCSANRS
jgi:hypothetical protein